MRRIGINFTSLGLIFLSAVFVYAQSDLRAPIHATTADGKAVLLKANGTWEYERDATTEKLNNDDKKFATIYFFRLKEHGTWSTSQSIFVNDKEFFRLRQESYLGIRIEPGIYKLKIRNRDRTQLTINLNAGETYFVQASVIAGAITLSYNLAEVPKVLAVYQIRPLTMVEPAGIKAKDLVVVSAKP